MGTIVLKARKHTLKRDFQSSAFVPMLKVYSSQKLPRSDLEALHAYLLLLNRGEASGTFPQAVLNPASVLKLFPVSYSLIVGLFRLSLNNKRDCIQGAKADVQTKF